MSLKSETKKAILMKLAEIGEVAFESRRAEMIPPIPKIQSLETKLRYLLLWSMIDQRTEAKIAGKIAFQLHQKFDEQLFYEPLVGIKRFDDVTKTFQESKYQVRFAYLNRNTVAALLVGSFLGFMMKINDEKETLTVRAKEGPTKFLKFLRSQKILSPLGEKAARMYVSFIGHPKLALTEVKYDKKELFVFVDGTVGKVFARTGLVERVPRYRGNQVYATKMRDHIDKLIQDLEVEDPMMVDGGAYALGKFCCDDVKPMCTHCDIKEKCMIKETCEKKCPLSNLGCLRQTKWMAYKT